MFPEKLLFVLPNLLGGGAERVTLTLLRELAVRGNEITLFLFKKEGVYWEDVPKGVRIRAVLPEGWRTRNYPVRVLLALVHELRHHDLVVGGLEGWPTFLSYVAAHLTRRPVVGWVHIALEGGGAHHWGRLERSLARWIYPRLDAAVCVSGGALASLRRQLGTNAPQWRSIPNPVQGRPLGNIARCTEARTPLVLAVGRLEIHQKGFDLLIRAHARLRREGLNQRLVILGEGPDRLLLENLAREEGVADSVALPGFTADVWSWYEKGTVFALSSRFEGLPTVIIEALAAGVPVVATDCESGPREILEDGKYGELVRSESCEALAEGLRRVLTDDSYRQRLAEAGPERAADFSPPHIADAWERMFAEVRA
jgi:glycosyltransferase involved in cell wall biosynthesis